MSNLTAIILGLEGPDQGPNQDGNHVPARELETEDHDQVQGKRIFNIIKSMIYITVYKWSPAYQMIGVQYVF